MRITKLQVTNDDENQKEILEYLEENASEALIQKINNGEKTLTGCWKFILREAQNYLKDKGKTHGRIKDDIVFGWAIHYFEEETIKEGAVSEEIQALYPEDEVEETSVKPTKPKEEKAPVVKKVKPAKPTKQKEEVTNKGYEQTSLFDLFD